MDILIIRNAFLCFLIFLILSGVILRFVKEKDTVRWLVIIYIFTQVFNLFLWIYLSEGLEPLSFLGGLVISSYLSLTLSLSYVLAFFGMMDSSIRVRLLLEIACSKDGLAHESILKKYNREIILFKRLERLKAGNDILVKNGELIIGNKFSYFAVHAFLYDLMEKIQKKETQ